MTTVALVGPDTLKFEFAVVGAVEKLLIPKSAVPERRYGLWQHSCFEAFIGLSTGGYVELNFSPSGQWAAYRFDAYRSGMADAIDLSPPDVSWERAGENRLLLTALVDVSTVEDLMSWTFGLSAVLEEKSDTKSYWALAHPDGAPDFHHKDCFALQLRPPETYEIRN